MRDFSNFSKSEMLKKKEWLGGTDYEFCFYRYCTDFEVT